MQILEIIYEMIIAFSISYFAIVLIYDLVWPKAYEANRHTILFKICLIFSIFTHFWIYPLLYILLIKLSDYIIIKYFNEIKGDLSHELKFLTKKLEFLEEKPITENEKIIISTENSTLARYVKHHNVNNKIVKIASFILGLSMLTHHILYSIF